MEKYIQLNEDSEKILTSICDEALKKGGMNTFHLVNQLISLIKEKTDE